jgi:hypothetical protein
MMAAPDLRSLSVQDYHRMVAAGILAADERVELPEAEGYGMEQSSMSKMRSHPWCFPLCQRSSGDTAFLTLQRPLNTPNFWPCDNRGQASAA